MARLRGSSPARGIQRRARRRTSWEDGPGGTASLIRTGAGATFLGSAITPIVPALTAVRLRGEFQIFLSVSTAGGGMSGAVGIGIASLAAVTAGIASVPTPTTEADNDNWLWHRFFYVRSAGVITPVADSNGGVSAVFRVEIDSKAMRKFTDGESIYAAVELTEEGTETAIVDLNSRLLVMLP